MTFVLDASITLTWILPGQATDRTDALLDRVSLEGAHVAAIWSLEVTNILLHAERGRRLLQTDVVGFVDRLSSLDIKLDSRSIETAFDIILPLARTHGLTTYDASYLELSMRLGLPLATDDEPMRTAAGRVGLELL